MLIPATTRPQIETVARLARVIWLDHYFPIIGKEQTEYMLEKFQSAEAISCQIKTENHQYFLIAPDEIPVGYLGLQPRDNDLFLSKIYIKSSHRGRGFGKKAIQHTEQVAKELRKPAITLSVNRHNATSIAAYSRYGFRIIDEAVTDIGNGFVMDDYIMQKPVAVQ